MLCIGIFDGASLVRLLLFNASLVHCFLDPRGIFGQIWIQGARQTSSAQCCHYKKVSFGRHQLMGMKSLVNTPQKMKKKIELLGAPYDVIHLWCAESLVRCFFVVLHLWCSANFVNYIFIAIFL